MGLMLSNIQEYVQKELFNRMDDSNRYNYSRTNWVMAKSWIEGAPVLMGGELTDKGVLTGGLQSYSEKKIEVGHQSYRPMSGITGISIQSSGDIGTTRSGTVNISVNNLQDLKRFSRYYMSVGATISLEWGWSIHGETPMFHLSNKLANAQSFNEAFENINRIRKLGGANYDCFVGQITNYSWAMRADGGFDCEIECIGCGNSMLFSPTESKAPKMMTKDGINLGNAFSKNREKGMYNLKSALNGYKLTGWLDDLRNDESSNHSDYIHYYEENHTHYITWGWMEDNIISKYLGYETNSGIIYDMRSIDTSVDSGDELQYKSVKITNHPELRCKDPNKFIIDNTGDFFGKKFAKFSADDKSKSGYLRNIWISVSTVASAFRDARTLDDAMKRLFTSLSSLCCDIWDLRLVQDGENITRIKVIDVNYTENKVDKQVDNSNRSTSQNPNKLFYFPVGDKRSIVQDCQMSATIPDAMAISTMYGRNQPSMVDNQEDKASVGHSSRGYAIGKMEGEKGRDTLMYGLKNPNNFGNPDGASVDTKLSGTGPDDKHTLVDKKDVSTSNLNDEDGGEGSDNQNTNDKIIAIFQNDGIETKSIQPLTYEGLNKIIVQETVSDAHSNIQKATFEAAENNIKEFNIEDLGLRMPDDTYDQLKLLIENDLKTSPIYHDINFLIPIEVSLTLDGIGGLRYGDAYHVDYILEEYKKQAVLQVTSVDHNLESSGLWTTTIKGKMRSQQLIHFNSPSDAASE